MSAAASGDSSERAAALLVIRARMKNDARMGDASLPEGDAALESVPSALGNVFFLRLASAAGDRYGYGDTNKRADAAGGGYGWGEKAVIANPRLQRAFVTTMGFHRYFFDLAHGGALGAPTSDEYSFEGGSRQDFELGSTFWAPSRGCWHVLAANAISEPEAK
jgi:hypothetical protein